MANARGQTTDKTHLSIDQAEVRGFLHRDYIAHCFRWSHICKYLNEKNRYKKARILDVGCGKDMPLAKTLMTSRMSPEFYLGVDFNKMDVPEMFLHTKFQPRLWAPLDFSKCYLDNYNDPEYTQFNYTACLEVLEHVEPWKAIKILRQIPHLTTDSAISWFSTPCYDEKVGAAKNHVNEMTYHAFGALLEDCGYKILKHWGTFASIKDYKHELEVNNYLDIFEKLRDYYDTNVLATIFAPCFPANARNVLWETQYVGKLHLKERRFTPIIHQEGRWGSSESWRELRHIKVQEEDMNEEPMTKVL